MNSFIKLIISLMTTFSIGFISSIFTKNSVGSWYKTIEKSILNPPDWIFAPVWTILYFLIAVAFFLVWKKNINKKIVVIYSIQLFFNFTWSILFFYLQNPLLALINILILICFIILNIKVFYPVSRFAAYLLIPYLLWVSFATFLNFSIVILN